MCMQFGTMCEAQDIVSAQGLQIEENVYNQKGDLVGTKTVVNPMVKVASDAFKNYKSMCIEFGMTPSSRTNVSMPDQKPNDRFADL